MEKDIIKAYYQKALDENRRFRPMMKRIYEFIQYNGYCWNNAENQNNSNNLGDRQDIKTFAANIAQYTTEFANNLTNVIFPYGTKFFNLEYTDNSNSPEDKKILNEISQKIFDNLLNSNLYQEAPKSFRDIAAGTGALLMNYSTDEEKIYFKALDVSKLYYLEDEVGIVSYVFRNIGVLTDMDRKRLYPNINFNTDDDISLIEYVIPIFENKKKKFKYIITDIDFENNFVEQVWDTNPFIIFRWNTYANENIGRGILSEHLSTLNLIDQYEHDILKATQLTLTPPIVTNDITFQQNSYGLDFSPGSLIPIGLGSTIEQLKINSNLPFARADIQLKEQEIINAFQIRPLSDMNSKEMTATEVTARLNQQINVLGGFANRHIRELIIPMIDRSIELLIKSNKIDKNLINSKLIKYTNPIAKLNGQIQVQSLMVALSQLNALGGQQGQVVINSTIKRGKVAEEIIKASGIDPAYYNDDSTIESEIEKVEQAQQAQSLYQLQASNPNIQQQL